jgi:hypothetical protein
VGIVLPFAVEKEIYKKTRIVGVVHTYSPDQLYWEPFQRIDYM